MLAEVGERLFDHYAKKLLVRGWAGTRTPAETAYVRAHRSEAQSRRAAQDAERMRARIATQHAETAPGALVKTSTGDTVAPSAASHLSVGSAAR